MPAATDPAVPPRFVLACDVGGTFTDTILLDRSTGRLWSTKVPSRARRQEESVHEGVKAVLADFAQSVRAAEVDGLSLDMIPGLGPLPFHHGSTVATNALLERRGAATGFVTNAGFEDLLAIRRQDRPDLYDLGVVRPEPLVSRPLRIGVPCRRGPAGEAWGETSEAVAAATDRAALALRAANVASVAVGFLHADRFPDDERAVATRLSEQLPGVTIVTSHEVWPEMREVERFETTVLNAYLAPVLGPYVGRLTAAVEKGAASAGGAGHVLVLDSAGTLRAPPDAARLPAAFLLSGPAGGVAAGTGLAKALGLGSIVTYDVGGTSTDVALVQEGVPRRSTESHVGGFACRFPAVEMHTLGAGGGSVLWRDPGGHLQVGPASQGANPGPACYGRGGEIPTLTDALLLAGRIPPGLVFGGRTRPDRKAAFRALEPLVAKLRQPLEETVLGAIRIAVAATAGGVQVVTTHRGHDPRHAALFAFGGAGPLIGADLAASLGMMHVVVPWDAGTFAARGMAAAPLVTRAAQGLAVVIEPDGRVEDLPQARFLEAAGVRPPAPMDPRDEVQVRVALRYDGQSYELEVPVTAHAAAADVVSAFHAEHQRAFGHAHPTRRVVALRAVVETVRRLADPGWTVQQHAGAIERPDGLAAQTTLWVAGPRGVEERSAPVLWRTELGPGNRLPGPLVVPDATATTFVPEGWSVEVDAATRALHLRPDVGGRA